MPGGLRPPAPQECQIMFVRLSAAIAAVSLLSSAALAQGAKPTDPQIAHIAYTAGVIDIKAAKQALNKTRNKEVKAFAQDMVRDHEAVNKQALDLVKKLKVKPSDSADRSLGQDRRNHRMDQQGYCRAHRDGAQRRLGCDVAAAHDRHPGFEEGRDGRLLLPLSSQHEGYAQDRAVARGLTS